MLPRAFGLKEMQERRRLPKTMKRGTASLDASGSLLLLRLERKKISSTPLNFRFSAFPAQPCACGQLGVNAALLDELRVGAAFENTVFADDHDFIRAADGG